MKFCQIVRNSLLIQLWCRSMKKSACWKVWSAKAQIRLCMMHSPIRTIALHWTSLNHSDVTQMMKATTLWYRWENSLSVLCVRIYEDVHFLCSNLFIHFFMTLQTLYVYLEPVPNLVLLDNVTVTNIYRKENCHY